MTTRKARVGRQQQSGQVMLFLLSQNSSGDAKTALESWKSLSKRVIHVEALESCLKHSRYSACSF